MMKIVSLLFISILLICCNQKDDAAEPNPYAAKFLKELNNSDTFRFDIPISDTYIKEIGSTSSQNKINFNKILNLKDLKKGIDSVEIRVKFDCVMSADFLMIRLNHNKEKWTAEISRIRKHFNIELEKVDSFSRKTKFDNPKSGWKEFITKLFELKVLSMEHESVIPSSEYSSPSDGCAISFEIATKNVYRFYGYRNPDIQNQKFWQVFNINRIEELLYREFEVLRKWNEQIEEDEQKEREIRLKEIEEKQKNKKLSPRVHEIFDMLPN